MTGRPDRTEPLVPPARRPVDDDVSLGEVWRGVLDLREATDRGFETVRGEFRTLDTRFVSRELYTETIGGLKDDIKGLQAGSTWLARILAGTVLTGIATVIVDLVTRGH